MAELIRIKKIDNFSKLSMNIGMVYCETDYEGMVTRDDFEIEASYDAPLLHSIQKSLSLTNKISKSELMDGSSRLQCYEGHSKGVKVDLKQIPLMIPYLTDSFRYNKTPVLFLIRRSDGEDGTTSTHKDSGISLDSRRTSTLSLRLDRKSSDLVRQFQNRTRYRSPRQPSVCISPDPPPTLPAPSKLGKKFSLDYSEEILRGGGSESEDREFLRPAIAKGSTISHLTSLSSSSVVFDFTRLNSECLSPPGTNNTPKSKPITPNKRLERKTAIRRMSRFSLDVPESKQVVVVSTEGGDWSTELSYHASMRVEEFTAAICEQLSKKWLTEDSEAKPFIITYKVKDTDYQLLNKSQFLFHSYFHKNSLEESPDEPGRLFVQYVSKPIDREMVHLFRITQLTRVILDMRVFVQGDIPQYTLVSPSDQPEVKFARRTLYDFITCNVTHIRDTESYSLSPEIITSATPPIVTLKVPLTNEIPITFHYENLFSFTRNVHIHKTATRMLKDIFPCVVACGLVKDNLENYVLQVTGEYSYIHGDHELTSYKDIRDFIVRGDPIHLSIVTRPCQDLYKPVHFNRPRLDPHTTSRPHHSDLIAMKSSINSSWTKTEPFRVKLCKLENLRFNQMEELLSVEISLHYGYKTLHQPISTISKLHVSFTAVWNQVLEFDITTRDIPRESKLLIVLRDSASITYYWGLLSVFDHEGKCDTGEHTLYLWEDTGTIEKKFQKKTVLEQETISFTPILAGPVTNNPNPSAVRAVVKIVSEQNEHIYYPSTEKRGRDDFWSHSDEVRNKQMKRHFQAHLALKFMSKDQKDYSNLHKHLLLVQWDNLSERLEVYYLLDELMKRIEEISPSIALRLLDSDFPDVNVRKFAIRVIQRLSDDELESYLLQLTQALKFEHLHDSPLARFLLKRALNNKMIGHHLFWYLRCEMQHFQYTPRFAVLLEAYLIGCGEAMLTRFKDQLEVLDMLESAITFLKGEYGKDTVAMQAALSTTLKKAELTKIAFMPISNPRLTVGRMRLEKCRVLSSAKRPMWLEFLNVSRSALTPSPVRLILKTGDDLRQDMITLKVLSLFDKLWKEQGLDLKLIPYGCIATSNKTGFIEVVKNAKTISAVSGVRENKKLYEWIKSHQLNEFGEVDPRKLEEAIKTFVHSCAGYSVATYVLGIGDRHNENIMITTSGNLFHIDFGHFLGNIKYFMHFKREWAPYVLTPDFMYVMGGEGSDNFKTYCRLSIRAFMTLRQNADLIINLFSMMRSTGIPELTCVEDTDYIKNALILDKPDREAEECFKNVIKKCIDLGWTVQAMWAFHKLRHSSN